jgi:NAD(P)-dependent dehydrogenase (short-subunit alcohol dehydrogenase family)
VQTATDDSLGGSLAYHHIDIRDTSALQTLIGEIASKHERMDGLIAAAGVQRQCAALQYPVEAIREMMEVNYVAVYTSAQAVAREMIRWGTPGAMCLVASMSATVSGFLLFCLCWVSVGCSVPRFRHVQFPLTHPPPHRSPTATSSPQCTTAAKQPSHN